MVAPSDGPVWQSTNLIVPLHQGAKPGHLLRELRNRHASPICPLGQPHPRLEFERTMQSTIEVTGPDARSVRTTVRWAIG